MNWPNRLKQFLNVALVQLPGREDRIHEAFSQTLIKVSTQIADELASVNARTLFIFGHSMGASIAWAVAGKLWQKYGLKPVVVLSAQSPHLLRHESNLNPVDLREWFKLLGEDFPEALEDAELLDLFQGTFSADCAWMSKELSASPVGRLPIDLHCLYGVQDGLIAKEQVAQWQDYTSASFTMTPMQGGHLYFLNRPEELLTFICHLIEVYRHHADSACVG